MGARHGGIYLSDEELFRIGSCPGANSNLAAYVRKEQKKSELSNDLVLRTDGAWQGAPASRRRSESSTEA